MFHKFYQQNWFVQLLSGTSLVTQHMTNCSFIKMFGGRLHCFSSTLLSPCFPQVARSVHRWSFHLMQPRFHTLDDSRPFSTITRSRTSCGTLAGTTPGPVRNLQRMHGHADVEPRIRRDTDSPGTAAVLYFSPECNILDAFFTIAPNSTQFRLQFASKYVLPQICPWKQFSICFCGSLAQNQCVGWNIVETFLNVLKLPVWHSDRNNGCNWAFCFSFFWLANCVSCLDNHFLFNLPIAAFPQISTTCLLVPGASGSSARGLDVSRPRLEFFGTSQWSSISISSWTPSLPFWSQEQWKPMDPQSQLYDSEKQERKNQIIFCTCPSILVVDRSGSQGLPQVGAVSLPVGNLLPTGSTHHLALSTPSINQKLVVAFLCLSHFDSKEMNTK